MKRLVILLFALFMLFVPAVIFASSCESAGEELPEYYILFSIDGQEYIYKFGVSDIEVNTFAVLFGDTQTDFFATDDNTASTENEPDNYILIFFLGNGPLDYTYGEDPLLIEFYSVDGMYAITAGTLTITKYGDVGDVIEGTFTATVEASFNGTETINLENGKFRILRIADDTPVPWSGPE